MIKRPFFPRSYCVLCEANMFGVNRNRNTIDSRPQFDIFVDCSENVIFRHVVFFSLLFNAVSCSIFMTYRFRSFANLYFVLYAFVWTLFQFDTSFFLLRCGKVKSRLRVDTHVFSLFRRNARLAQLLSILFGCFFAAFVFLSHFSRKTFVFV